MPQVELTKTEELMGKIDSSLRDLPLRDYYSALEELIDELSLRREVAEADLLRAEDEQGEEGD